MIDGVVEHEYYQMGFAKAVEKITRYRSCCIWRWPYFLPHGEDIAQKIFDELVQELGDRETGDDATSRKQKALSLKIGGEPAAASAADANAPPFNV